MKNKKNKFIKKHIQYNRKEFLAPTSIRSMAAVHCKIKKNGEASIRISDCNHSIKIWNDMNSQEEALEMIEKINNLIDNLRELKREVGFKIKNTLISNE